jgi:hypothetical protein
MKAEILKAERPVHEQAKPQDLLQTLNDAELAAFVAAGVLKIAAREKRRKDEAIAKIRALAGAAGLSVAIEGARGRPGGRGSTSRSKKRTPEIPTAGQLV